MSLVHYSAKIAVFLPGEASLEMVANCVSDERDTVYKAIGWVSHENMTATPDEVIKCLHEHAPTMSAPAIRRSTERLPPKQRQRVRDSLH
ncbi:MAG: DNA alkylation repair protein [Actinomycetota bacterium]